MFVWNITFPSFEILSLNTLRWYRQIPTISNEDGNANDDGSGKSHSRLTLYFFVRFIRVLFYPLYKAKQILTTYLLYVLAVHWNSKKRSFLVLIQQRNYIRAGAQLDTFQRALIVFVIVLCCHCRRHRPLCSRSLFALVLVMPRLVNVGTFEFPTLTSVTLCSVRF